MISLLKKFLLPATAAPSPVPEEHLSEKGCYARYELDVEALLSLRLLDVGVSADWKNNRVKDKVEGDFSK